MIRLDSSTLSNQNLSAPLLSHTYTVTVDGDLVVSIFLAQIAGNGDYSAYLTIQRQGVGDAFQTDPVIRSVAAGVTSVPLLIKNVPPVKTDDIIKVYVVGLPADTTTPDVITEIWEESLTLTETIVVSTEAYYGSATEVAALAQIWTREGSWVNASPGVDATIPSLSQVAAWLVTVSAMIDLALVGAGFTTPVVVSTVLSAAGMFVSILVADLCHAANSSGRFYTSKVLERGGATIIWDEILKWVELYADGFESAGVPRSATPNLAYIGYRSSDLEERIFGIWDSQ